MPGDNDPNDIFKSLDALLDAEAPRAPPPRESEKRKQAPTVEPEETLCVVCQDDVSFPKGELPCSHMFCHPCIVEWGKRSNLCPVCKRRFVSLKRISDKGRITTRKIKKRDFADTYDSESIGSSDYNSGEEDGACLICGADDNPYKLFFCDTDGCPNLQHDYCCVPRLECVPEEGEFFCTDCVKKYNKTSNYIAPNGTQEGNIQEGQKEKEAAPLPPPVDRTVPRGAPPIDSTATIDKSVRMVSVSQFEPLAVPAYTQPPRNPNASQGLDDYITPLVNRRTNMLEIHTAFNRRNLQEIRQAWKEQIGSSSSPSAVQEEGSDNRPRLTEEYLKTLSENKESIISEWTADDKEVVKPRRSLSAAEWNKKFSSKTTDTQQSADQQDSQTTPKRSNSATEGTPRRSIPAAEWSHKYNSDNNNNNDGAKQTPTDSQLTPRRSISAAEWSQKFKSTDSNNNDSSQPSQTPRRTQSAPDNRRKPSLKTPKRSSRRERSHIRAKGDRASRLQTYYKRHKVEMDVETENLTTAELANIEQMLSELRCEIQEKKRTKRTRVEIYSARGAITSALIIAAAVQRKTMKEYSSLRHVDGVPVTSELRNTVIRTGKLFLTPLYSSKSISKETFKLVLSESTDLFLYSFVNKHRTRLQNDPYSFHEVLSEGAAESIARLCDRIVKREKKK